MFCFTNYEQETQDANPVSEDVVYVRGENGESVLLEYEEVTENVADT